MLQNLTGWHLVIILGVVVLLFGATKLPALAKGVGQSIKIFKSEVVADSDEPAEEKPAASVASHDVTPAA